MTLYPHYFRQISYELIISLDNAFSFHIECVFSSFPLATVFSNLNFLIVKATLTFSSHDKGWD